MADSPAWPNTGEMVLCEIYLHQHSPTNGYFDLFHIYEFRNYLDQPQVPSFSTNCTEPDDLNKALLKMNHLENLDTSEIQRRLVDCVDQGEDTSQQAVVYSSNQHEEVMYGMAEYAEDGQRESITWIENEQLVPKQEPLPMNIDPTPAPAPAPIEETPLLISNIGTTTNVPPELPPSLVSITPPPAAVTSPSISPPNCKIDTTPTIIDNSEPLLVPLEIEAVKSSDTLPDESSEMPLVISSVFGMVKIRKEVAPESSTDYSQTSEEGSSPLKSPAPSLEAVDGDIRLVDIIEMDELSTEKESQNSEENISKSSESIIPEDEMIELLEHVPTMLEAIDEDTPLLSQLCDSLVTEGLDEPSDEEEEGRPDNADTLRLDDNLEEYWWHSGGGSPPKATVLNGKTARSSKDQTDLSEMTIIGRPKPDEVKNAVASTILLSDSESDEVEIIETVEGAKYSTENVSHADDNGLSISKNILREIICSDIRKKRKRLLPENQFDEHSNQSNQSSESGGPVDHILLVEAGNQMDRDGSLSKRVKSNGSQSNNDSEMLENNKSNAETHTCPKCHNKFDDLVSLKLHILTHRPKQTLQNIHWHKCLNCNSQFVRPNLLEKHLKFCNYKKRKSQSKDVVSPVNDTSKADDYTIQNPSSRDTSVPSSQRPLSTGKNNDSIEKVCESVAPIQPRADQNTTDLIEIIDCDKPLSCSTVSRTKVYVCQVCFKTIHHFDAFKMHMMTHNQDKQSCEECSHKFKTRKELDKHYWNEHVAKICDESTTVKDDDEQTEILDTGNKLVLVDIRCEVCLEMFPNRKTMKNHVRLYHPLFHPL